MDQFSHLDRLSKGTRAYIILFFLTFVTALPGVFTMPPLDRDESRFAQASKQMLETGDYIMIRYQDGQRNKKPAGIHWLQAGATAVFSSAEAKQIWSYRLPSFIGGALATCALFWAGIPLLGRRAAFLGAALFGTGLLLTSEAHISKTDGVLVAITTLGVGALIYLRAGIGRLKPLALLFWFAMGFGFLIKGPVTPMVAFMAIIFVCLWERRGWKWPVVLIAGICLVFLDNYLDFGSLDKPIGWGIKAIGVVVLLAVAARFILDERKEAWFRALIWWPGPLLWVAMVLPWFLSIQMATDGAFFQGAVGKDLKDKVVGASEGHGGMPGYHLLNLFSHFFPATLFLIPGVVLAIRKIHKNGKDASGLLFLVAWAVPTWVLFEALPTKLSHYVLPAYPPLALLSGYAALKLCEGAKLPVSRLISVVFFALGGAVIALFTSPLAVELLQTEAAGDFKTVSPETVLASWSGTQIIWWPLIPGVICLLLTIGFAVFKRAQWAVAFALMTSLTLGWHTRISFLPKQVWVQATTTARLALAEVCGLPDQKDCDVHPSQIQAIGYAEPSFVFTTGTDVKISPNSSPDLPPASEFPVMAYVINLEDTESAGAVELIRNEAAAQDRCVTESTYHYALNYSNNDPANFVALRVDHGPCG